MSGPNQRRDLSNCGTRRLQVAINCGVLSVNHLHLLVHDVGNKIQYMNFSDTAKNIQVVGAFYHRFCYSKYGLVVDMFDFRVWFHF